VSILDHNYWPQGPAMVTMRWQDGTELVVNRVEIGPEDLSLITDPEPATLPDIGNMKHWPPRCEKGRISLQATIVPDDQDCFYVFRMGT
jgi:hypothetical protein